jgi:hypothetical protein
MSILSNTVKAGLAAAAFAGAIAVSGAASAESPAPARASKCFFTTQWRGWSSPAPGVIYLDVGAHKVYRVDVAGGGSHLKRAGYFLVSNVRGSSSICSALDLDLAVADNHGYYLPLIPQKLTLLTPEEVAAIPRKDRP